MNRVQHQTKKKKVFVDNKNSAFSQRNTDDAASTESSNTSGAPPPSEHQQQKQQKKMAFKKVNNNNNNNTATSTSASGSVSNSAISKFTCCICCEESSVRTIFQTCNHSDVCHKCSLRLRVLNNDNRCCICKNASECVIFSQRQNIKSFSEYTKDDLVYDETWKVYTDDYLLMNDITSLRRIECRLCKESGVTLAFENSNLLNNHMNEVHKLNYCAYCLASRKVFLCEQKLYNWSNLMKHIRFGEEDPNYGKIEGHPLCKFCNVRFYSDDEIFDHMYKRHERCFICQKHGVQFEFYHDYKHLERHFDQKHFLCPHSECKEDGFKVFENELELMAHKNRYHSSTTSTSKKSKTQKLDLSTLSTTTHLPTDDERRQVRTGEINSSIIRFVDTAGDGYHNDNIHKKQPGESSNNKKQKQKKEKESSSDFKEKNNQLVKKMKELLSENQFQDLKVLSSQFLRGDTLASEYYSKVISMLGEEKTKDIFDLMVEAIPPQDENKKKALLLAKNTYHSAEFNPNLGKEDANTTSSPQSSSDATPQNWPTLNNGNGNGNNNKSKSSDPNWNPQNPQPTPNQQSKKKNKGPIAHNITRNPDLLWGVQTSTAPSGLNKEMEFPTLPTAPSSSKSSKKANSNWTKPLKEEKKNSNSPYSEFGNIKVYKFSESKKKNKNK
ncbi:predicted protein [Naegleria gruberi]|uniref:RING-type E3 ubiquitin transferase n=1 Tax=Naegleria gruberi TaxID=5762 RepID=D2VH54_NAEGR|nr:uncharacterized protein NAEGRDRAFT_68280 [Naegleria gruberi]EFC43833.1 predicted protein [Naegleria gruberi]|eukprot:XP_002676577.1 predicted protein [Naegleria gruberi strain NEG-M]